jgi:hypothetical protein
MIFVILGGIIAILLLISYIVTLNRKIKLQSKIIEEEKDMITKEKISHKYTKAQYDIYYRSYVELVDKFNNMFGEKGVKITEKDKVSHEYDMDDILNEIASRGIKNVSKDKLEFLKKIGKNDTDKR